MNSSAFWAAQDYLYNKYQGVITEQSTLTNWGYGFGVADYFTETSLSGQFLGSVAIEETIVSDGMINFTFKNQSTVDSVLYSSGRLEFLNIERTLNHSPPTSTIRQTIHVTVPIDRNWPLDPDFCERTGACQ